MAEPFKGGGGMKIAWYSNAPWGPTGYGTQTAMIVPRLVSAGHEVAIMANWGQQVNMGSWNDVPVYPQGLEQYSLDVVDAQANSIDPDIIVTLYDTWPLLGRNIWQGRRVASWTPVDHYPVPPKVQEWCKSHETIAMSKFGHQSLSDVGIQSTYIPHGIESTYRPVISDIRRRMSVPDDAFLVVINQANIGNAPPRKAWDQNLQAMADLMRSHPDVYLYIHSDLNRPGGVPIHGICSLWGVPMDRVRIAEQTAYRLGIIDADELVRIYSAADVMLACSMGEGFGLTPAEAMRCGTPAIVTNFSAQPEIVGDTGWKTTYQLFYDQGQHAALAMPLIYSIRQALEEAYKERGTDAASVRRQQAIQHSSQYDADHVFNEHWMPWLKRTEASMMRKADSGVATTKANHKRKRRR